jgi:hypothetical protein
MMETPQCHRSRDTGKLLNKLCDEALLIQRNETLPEALPEFPPFIAEPHPFLCLSPHIPVFSAMLRLLHVLLQAILGGIKIAAYMIISMIKNSSPFVLAREETANQRGTQCHPFILPNRICFLPRSQKMPMKG